jgi:RNA binding exosome subunit
VFCKEDEDEDSIVRCLRSLVPFELEREGIDVMRQKAVGFNEKTIKVLEVSLRQERHTNAFITNLRERLGPEQLATLLNQKQSRLDEQLNFFLRLDKKRLLAGNWQVTDEGNCFHIRMSIAAFPKNRLAALAVVQTILGA